MPIRRLLILAAIVLVALAASNGSQAAGESHGGNLFPYAFSVDDLPNGLRLVTVPTD